MRRLLFSPGPVLVTAEGDARVPHHETGAARAHVPGRGGGGTAADPALAAADTVTATSRAPDTSKYTRHGHAGSSTSTSVTGCMFWFSRLQLLQTRMPLQALKSDGICL